MACRCTALVSILRNWKCVPILQRNLPTRTSCNRHMDRYPGEDPIRRVLEVRVESFLTYGTGEWYDEILLNDDEGRQRASKYVPYPCKNCKLTYLYVLKWRRGCIIRRIEVFATWPPPRPPVVTSHPTDDDATLLRHHWMPFTTAS